MKAITYSKYGPPGVLKYQDVPDPEPKEGEVLVEIIASSVNPIDIKIRNGSFKALAGKKFPKIPGADLAGKVILSKHPGFNPGDKVYGMNQAFAGGCNAEKIAIPGDYLSAKPEVLSYNTAAIMPLVGLTAIQAMLIKCKLKPNSNVLINGCTGGVGSMAVQIATSKHAQISGVCSEKNENFARELGVDNVVSYEHEDIHGLGPFDMIFDTVGTLKLSRIKKMLKPGGNFVTTSVNPSIYLKSRLSKSIHFVVVKPNAEHLKLLTALIEEKHIIPKVDKDFPLESLDKAHEYVAKGHTRGKVIIRVKTQ